VSAAGWVAVAILLGGAVLVRLALWIVDGRRYGRHS
jgi:hypothetical protein